MELQEAIQQLKTKTGSLIIDLFSKQIKDEGARAIGESIENTKLNSFDYILKQQPNNR